VIEISVTILAIAIYYTLQYNFLWFFGLVAFNVVFAKSLAFKVALLIIAGYYCYEAIDYTAYAIHRAPVTFDLLAVRNSKGHP
jgi:hypothetical protein